MDKVGTLFTDALGAQGIVRLSGREAMSELPTYVVDLVLRDATTPLRDLIGAPATLEIRDAHGAMRSSPLLVIRARHAGPSRDGHRFTLELSSFAFPMTLRSGYRVFLEQTTQQIVAEVLRSAGIGADRISWRLGERYARRPQCAQYDESEWGFILRLCADEGIACWFEETDDGAPLLCFGDAEASHTTIAGDPRLPFEDESGLAAPGAAFFDLGRCDEIAPEAVFLRDDDVRHPDVPIEGRAGSSVLEHYEFPAGVPLTEAAEARARIRLEQLRRLSVSLTGASTCARLQPGRVVEIEGAADAWHTGRWLIVAVEHEIAESTPNAPIARPYRNRVKMIPHDRAGSPPTFRPAVQLGRPRIDGIETATVTGPPGEEVHVDDLGRVTLMLPWDPSGIRDDRSSRPCRALQMNMSGSMLLPRVGWEVAIAYRDGSPDEPVVIGQVYNGNNPPPYALPENMATSALRSDTSPYDGSSNEIRFGDSAGSEEVWIHAANTQAVSVGGSASTTVAAAMTHDVKLGFGVSVDGAQSTTVGGSQEVVVASDHSVEVGGGRSESIGGSESLGIAANRAISAGTYGELVGGVYALQCNTAFTTVGGGYLELVGGNLVQAAGLGTNESVAAIRQELVGGALNILAASAYADDTMGSKTITVGPASERAAQVTATGATVSVQVGGGMSARAGGRVILSGAAVSITAGSLLAKGGSKLALGGSIEVAGGTTKFDAGTLKRTAGAEEEA